GSPPPRGRGARRLRRGPRPTFPRECRRTRPASRWGPALLLHSECLREPDVALDDVAHVADAGAELQGAPDAEAEGEAGVLLRVDAAGDEDPRVDHPAATPLDPARAVAVLGEPDVE